MKPDKFERIPEGRLDELLDYFGPEDRFYGLVWSRQREIATRLVKDYRAAPGIKFPSQADIAIEAAQRYTESRSGLERMTVFVDACRWFKSQCQPTKPLIFDANAVVKINGIRLTGEPYVSIEAEFPFKPYEEEK